MITDEIREKRKTGLGSSDIPAILGLSKYKSPLDIYLDKTGHPTQDKPNQFTHWGNLMEEPIAQEYARLTGAVVHNPNELKRHHEHPFLLANVDRLIGNDGILECKTASAYKEKLWGEPGTDQIPEEYLVQVAHQSKVYEQYGIKYVDIAVLIGGNDFRIYRYNSDKNLEDRIANFAITFWNDHVLKRVPPPARTESDIKILYPKDDMSDAVATNDAIEILNHMKDIRDQIDVLSKKEEEYKNHVKLLIANASRLIDSEGRKLATWTSQNTQRFDTTTFKKKHPEMYNDFCKTTEIRVFRIS